jgi:glutathione reductase (NADPH)
VRQQGVQNISNTFYVIIIGSGNAGFVVSAVAHAASKKIVSIEERYFGGTCPNRGCAPNNILDAASHALDEIEIVFAHAVIVGKTNPD